mgnify:CR=1 FL=1
MTLVLASFAMNHLWAALLVWNVTRHVDSSAHEHFSYKTLAALLRMAHQHSFGHGVMYFITGAIFLLADLPDRITLPLLTAAFVGAWLDSASWFLLKYSSAQWEFLSMISGAAFTASFFIMTGISLHQMWSRQKNT